MGATAKNTISAILGLMLAASCGKPRPDCITADQARYLCYAKAAERWAQGTIPEWEKELCNSTYPIGGCYEKN